ncbi:hypothetical protein HMI54_004493 [Coelomomyces lativittatus]|nr:hypothetical protein HMI54_004493 [Coelomomyces lativittatus]
MSHHLWAIYKIRPDLTLPHQSPSPPPPPLSQKPSSSSPVLRPTKGNPSDTLAPSSYHPQPSFLSSSALRDVPSTIPVSGDQAFSCLPLP